MNNEEILKELTSLETAMTHSFRHCMQAIARIKTEITVGGTGVLVPGEIMAKTSPPRQRKPEGASAKKPNQVQLVSEEFEQANLDNRIAHGRVFAIPVRASVRTEKELQKISDIDVVVFYSDEGNFKGYQARLVPFDRGQAPIPGFGKWTPISAATEFSGLVLEEVYEAAKNRLDVKVETMIGSFFEKTGISEVLVIEDGTALDSE